MEAELLGDGVRSLPEEYPRSETEGELEDREE